MHPHRTVGELAAQGFDGVGLGRERAQAALRKAVEFYRTKVATEGGYHFAYAEDLSYGRSEMSEGPTRVEIQREGTPLVGLAYLEEQDDTFTAFDVIINPSDGKRLYRAGLARAPQGDRSVKTQFFTVALLLAAPRSTTAPKFAWAEVPPRKAHRSRVKAAAYFRLISESMSAGPSTCSSDSMLSTRSCP